MNCVLFLFVFMAACSVVHPLDEWTQISLYDICFEATGDKPGFLYNYKESKLIGALRLVWKRGEVRCVSDVAYSSKWGCYRHASFKESRLNVIITDFNNNVIFPKPEYITHAAGLWYWLPGVDEKHSNELVFTDFAKPFYFQHQGLLKIWYGEDLKNSGDTDNQGRVCVEVYARFV